MSIAARSAIAPREFTRFLLVGLSNTALSASLFWAWLTCVDGGLGSAPVAQATSYLGGLIWSYAWNRSWTFGTRARGAGLRFSLLQVTLLVVSAVAVGVLVEGVHVRADAAWLGVMAAVTLANYLGQRHWVFAG